jgi:hypothetical protein
VKLIECVDAGARLLNLSTALVQLPSSAGERSLGYALDFITQKELLVKTAGLQYIPRRLFFAIFGLLRLL